MKQLFNVLTIMLLLGGMSAQAQFTAADTLRGMLRPERTCYDVRFYDLSVEVDINKRSIKGSNAITFKTLRGFNMIQLDLFANMKIDSIVHKDKKLEYYRKHDAFFVDFGSMQDEGKMDTVVIYYHGTPTAAVNPPWDGGFSWNTDKAGRPWVGVSCEGVGASLWWPNKDHLSDEPDSMRIRCTVPKGLTCVANGVLRNTQNTDKNSTFEWFVSYPINNYNVTLNIANYVHFSDTFVSPTDKSKLALDYYVLAYNLERARKQFKQVPKILAVFEKYLDKYPFWNDGYALVETPYLGMEHQGAIAYGNQYMDGYLGRHIPEVPEDFIILHETGHEWWGNSVSCNDLAEMWIHETFTTYMEMVYAEEVYGYEVGLRYLQAEAMYIQNGYPIIAPKDVNFHDHSTDIYYKGAVMLHTLRRAIDNDKLWWELIKSFYQKFKIGHARTEDFIKHVQDVTNQDYMYLFNQYLYYADVPLLQTKSLRQVGKNVEAMVRWKANVSDFRLPVRMGSKSNKKLIVPNTRDWTRVVIPNVKLEQMEVEFGLFGLEMLED